VLGILGGTVLGNLGRMLYELISYAHQRKLLPLNFK
jgi:hypothetical protein